MAAYHSFGDAVKILALTLLIAIPCTAEPVREPLRAGQAAPADGVWLSTLEAARIVGKCTEASTERDALRKALTEEQEVPRISLVVVSSVVGILVGVFAGFFLAQR